MPRKLPRYVHRHLVKGRVYLYFRIGKGPRFRLPDDPTSPEFREAYAAALVGNPLPRRTQPRIDKAGSIGALIASYLRSAEFKKLRQSSKEGYMRRLNIIREEHGHRIVAKMTDAGVRILVLQPLADRPGAALDTLKKLRILIRHARVLGWLKHDPSEAIRRPKTREIRAWTDAELAAFEARWPIGTKQRTAYMLMLYLGTARIDVHKLTWTQIDQNLATYSRTKTGVEVVVEVAPELAAALAAWPRKHLAIITTEFGKPFTVDGFSRFMRAAIDAAGLPKDCKPHGLRKTLGRKLADAGGTAHEVMAVLGHTTLAEAERYTREADRRRGGRAAIQKLADYKANKTPQTSPESLGETEKTEGKSK